VYSHSIWLVYLKDSVYLSVGDSVAESKWSVVSCVGLSLGQSGVVRGLTLTTPFHSELIRQLSER